MRSGTALRFGIVDAVRFLVLPAVILFLAMNNSFQGETEAIENLFIDSRTGENLRVFSADSLTPSTIDRQIDAEIPVFRETKDPSKLNSYGVSLHEK